MRIKMEAAGEYFDIPSLRDTFPKVTARALGYVGKQAAIALYENHLKGQHLRLYTDRFSPSGVPLTGGATARDRPVPATRTMRMITYSIARGLKWVAISSFPLNLYEDRKNIRKGDLERKGILREKLPNTLRGRLASYLKEADTHVFDEWFNEKKKGGMKLKDF